MVYSIRRPLLYILLCSFISFTSCVDDALPGRDVEPDFKITDRIPSFTLALGDSVVIDMSNYWTFTDADYKGIDPPVAQIKADSNLFVLRTVYPYLIIKGTEVGQARISVRSKSKTWADLCNPYHLTDPVTFEVTVDSTVETDVSFGGAESELTRKLKGVRTMPKTFGMEDTVHLAPDARSTIVDATWFIFNGENLDEMFACAPIGTHAGDIRVRVTDSTARINGYIAVSDSLIEIGDSIQYWFRTRGRYFQVESL